MIDEGTLDRWKANPISFIEEALCDPETGAPFVLLEAEREFMTLAFELGEDGRLKFPEMLFGAPKKSGKTTLAALIVLTMVLLRSESRFSEAYIVANDLEQARSRAFTMAVRIVECSPILKAEAKITANRIAFESVGATITAISSDAASAAGGNPVISAFDELWGYTLESSRRLWDELVPSPAQKISCRLVTTYAGFTGESTLLEDLFNRGMALPEVGPSLKAGDGMLSAWHTLPIAPWQTEAWLADMRKTMRPPAFARMILNQFVSPETKFIDLAIWDSCVQPSLTPVLRQRGLPIWIGVDASTKRDSTALVACTFDKKTKCVRLVNHKVFTPTPDSPIDFEGTVEATLREWQNNFAVQQILFDPFQMASVAQRLVRERMPIEEFPQTVPNLTATTSNLHDLLSARTLVLYPDAGMRLSVSQAIISESSRGLKIDKLKQSQKIDVIVALSMAALAAVRADGRMKYDLRTWFPETVRDPTAELQAAFSRFVSSGGYDR